MKTTIIGLLTILTVQAFAETSVWQGEGTLFDKKGKIESTYKLTVKNVKEGSLSSTDVTVTLPNGKEIKQQCTNTYKAADAWKTDCGYGKGGGRCFGDGLCQSYVEDENNHAFATTIILDGANDMRLMRNELKNGEAVRFFREKLHKQ